jgi:hypothetical protein
MNTTLLARYGVAAFAFIMPLQLCAQSDESGNRLQHDCRLAIDLSGPQKSIAIPDPVDWIAVGYCYGRIEGVINTALLWHKSNVDSGHSANGEPCIPTGVVSTSEATKVVLKYLDDHPEQLHVLGTALILNALKEAYPCNVH